MPPEKQRMNHSLEVTLAALVFFLTWNWLPLEGPPTLLFVPCSLVLSRLVSACFLLQNTIKSAEISRLSDQPNTPKTGNSAPTAVITKSRPHPINYYNQKINTWSIPPSGYIELQCTSAQKLKHITAQFVNTAGYFIKSLNCEACIFQLPRKSQLPLLDFSATGRISMQHVSLNDVRMKTFTPYYKRQRTHIRHLGAHPKNRYLVLSN